MTPLEKASTNAVSNGIPEEDALSSSKQKENQSAETSKSDGGSTQHDTVASSPTSKAGAGQECEVREGLKRVVLHRQASLTVGEKAFLSALLLDAPKNDDENKKLMASAKKVLDDDVLFSVPIKEDESADNDDQGRNSALQPPKTKRNQSHHIGLWRAHEDGVKPKMLVQKHSSIASGSKSPTAKSNDEAKEGTAKDQKREETVKDEEDESSLQDGSEVCSIKSDEEVRRPADEGDDDASSASSWDLSEGGYDHYDAWAVLKDEYSRDFGFDFSDPCIDDDDERGAFKIIGTSADDVSAHPHVLSPPLMDSLLSFVPDTLQNDNFWLKFSLVRDGANLEILKRYIRAAPHTILAIETTNGDVFGSYTSSTWRASFGYFGSGESFLWKMRHSRLAPCHSLFEQAQLESEIDVYPYSGLNDYIQLLTKDKLAVGGGELDTSGQEQHGDAQPVYVYLEEGEHYGFGLCISEDLLHGTSSPCATFRNPCLVNHSSKGEVFEIVNLEVWTFTPCDDVQSAERLEMTKFFVQESVLSSMSSMSAHSHSRAGSAASTGVFSSTDLVQEEFYRRVGDRDEGELDRDGWQYAQMMNPTSMHHSSIMRNS